MTLPEIEPAPHTPTLDTVSDYEAWASKDWLHEQGTLPAQDHARGKFEEEIEELSEALDSGVAEDIVSEVGDVLWTAMANASNTGIGLADSLRWYVPDRFGDGEISLELVDAVAADLFVGFNQTYQHNMLSSLKGNLAKYSHQWFSLKNTVGVDKPSENFAQVYIDLKRERTEHGLAMTTLLCSAIAQEAGSSIREVIRVNVEKLTQRMAEGKPITKPPTI